MSDKYPENAEQELSQGGLSRRSFFKGAGALTGAALATTAFGGAVMSRES